MQIYTRYKTGRSRSILRAAFHWILVLAGIAFIVWIFLDAQRSTEPRPRPLPPTAQAPSPRSPTSSNPPPATPGRTTVPPGGKALAPLSPLPGSPGAQSPSPFPSPFPRPVRDVLESQIALARQGISCGSFDGVLGPQTRTALRVFQAIHDLRVTGQLDAATRDRLVLDSAPMATYVVGPQDFSRLLPLSRTWMGKSLQPRLDYETILELVAERHHAYPSLIQQLNPGLNWTSLAPGTTLLVPNPALPPVRKQAAMVKIYLSSRTLQAFDDRNQMLAHFPCSIAKRVDKRPVGMLQVVVIISNPNYTFRPEIFPESPEAQEIGHPLVLPAGPNNPVGTVWIALDRRGYGIHGTPRPEDVGRTESHGCFRLSNWNAEHLAQLVGVGTPIFVEP